MSDLRITLSKLAAEAQNHLLNDNFVAAGESISKAFREHDAAGSPTDVAFVAVLCVAADLSADTGELEGAASLYNTACNMCDTLALGGRTNDLTALTVRAKIGLARMDVLRGYDARAQSRYADALTVADTIARAPEEILGELRAGARGDFCFDGSLRRPSMDSR